MTTTAASNVRALALAAREAARLLATSPIDTRKGALEALAEELNRRESGILAANALDLAEAADGLAPAALQRLHLDRSKVAQMAAGARALASLPDPLNQVQLHRRLDEGLILTQVSCPLGVLGVVFESRPDALVQIGALALKSGNAALLKGGREAHHTHAALMEAVDAALARTGLPAASLQALADREAVGALLELDDLVDLMIPRGSKALVRQIRAMTKIPVLGHADGVCHMYLDAKADPAMALALVRDAKLQYPAACNATETVLIHAKAAPTLLPALVADLRAHGARLLGCPRSLALVRGLEPAADWDTEYGEATLALRVVEDLDEALAHIRRHGSGHTEAIVTEDPLAAERFLAEVDAAGVYHNASTRFADGYRYGFGAEVGISTSRIHARGPVGLAGLLSYRYLLRGAGHRVADYSGAGARAFLHEDL